MTTPGSTPEDVRLLLEALSTGDVEEAWDRFLSSYADLVFQVVSILDRDPDNRGDSFLYACEQLHRNRFRRLRQFKLDGKASFSTWLRAVVRNLYIDWRRQRFGRTARLPPLSLDQTSGSEGRVLADQLSDEGPDPETAADDFERKEALRRALGKLQPSEVKLLRLRFADELTLDELSKVYGLGSPQSARYRLQRVLDKLRERL